MRLASEINVERSRRRSVFNDRFSVRLKLEKYTVQALVNFSTFYIKF